MRAKSSTFRKLFKFLGKNIPHFFNNLHPVRFFIKNVVKRGMANVNLVHNVSMNIQNFNDEIKERIIAIRTIHKLSQSQIAVKSGYRLHTYKKIEREISKGGIKVTGEHIRDLCVAYDLSADYFIFGTKLGREQPEFYFDK